MIVVTLALTLPSAGEGIRTGSTNENEGFHNALNYSDSPRAVLCSMPAILLVYQDSSAAHINHQ